TDTKIFFYLKSVIISCTLSWFVLEFLVSFMKHPESIMGSIPG
ncbi:unnamed protein product, partial [marine sediment metagenome]